MLCGICPVDSHSNHPPFTCQQAWSITSWTNDNIEKMGVFLKAKQLSEFSSKYSKYSNGR